MKCESTDKLKRNTNYASRQNEEKHEIRISRIQVNNTLNQQKEVRVREPKSIIY